MPRFDVHLYTLVRVKARNILADDKAGAIVEAERQLSEFNTIDQMFDSDDNHGYVTELAGEEIVEALVDVAGDESNEGSQFFDKKDGNWLPVGYIDGKWVPMELKDGAWVPKA